MTLRELTAEEQRQHDREEAAAKREQLERAAPGFPQPGSTWHALKTGVMFAGRVLSRGDEFQPTAEQISATFDRIGSTPLSSWGTPDSGIQPGAFPKNEPVLLHGTVEWEESRNAAIARARRAEDPDLAFAEVRAKYGAPKDSVVWVDYPDTSNNKSKWSR